MTARAVWVVPVAGVVAGAIVGTGLVLLAADSLLRAAAWATRRQPW